MESMTNQRMVSNASRRTVHTGCQADGQAGCEVSAVLVDSPDMKAVAASGTDVLSGWADARGAARTALAPRAARGLRFAFYGRVSTEDHQDPATSHDTQICNAQAGVPPLNWTA
jgi:hypothetical protein